MSFPVKLGTIALGVLMCLPHPRGHRTPCVATAPRTMAPPPRTLPPAPALAPAAFPPNARRADSLEVRIDGLIEQLSEGSLRWDCYGTVWSPQARGPAPEALTAIGKPATARLLRVLDEPGRGFVANFLLRDIWDGGEHRFVERLGEVVDGDSEHYSIVDGIRWDWPDVADADPPSPFGESKDRSPFERPPDVETPTVSVPPTPRPPVATMRKVRDRRALGVDLADLLRRGGSLARPRGHPGLPDKGASRAHPCPMSGDHASDRVVDLVAFGLVNAGKSSLLNALARRSTRPASPIGGTTTGLLAEDWCEVVARSARIASG